jgi:uncharacterized protein DUF1573/peptidase C39-like protein
MVLMSPPLGTLAEHGDERIGTMARLAAVVALTLLPWIGVGCRNSNDHGSQMKQTNSKERDAITPAQLDALGFPIAVYHLRRAIGDSAVSLKEIRRGVGKSASPKSLLEARQILACLSMNASVRTSTLSAVLSIGRPCIMKIVTEFKETRGSYVVCLGRSDRGVTIIDPFRGRVDLSETDLQKMYSGSVLIVDLDAVQVPSYGPDILCDQLIWDFGTARSGEEPGHRFRIRNSGTMPLIITDVHSDCSCTFAVVVHVGQDAQEGSRAFGHVQTGRSHIPSSKERKPVTIEAGGEAYLGVRMKTTCRKGRVASRFLIESNDPEEPKLELFAIGTIIRVIERDPPVIILGGVEVEKGKVGHLWVRHYLGETIRISDLRTASSNVVAEIDEDPPRGERALRSELEGKHITPRVHPKKDGWVGIKVEVSGKSIGGKWLSNKMFSAVSFKANGIEMNVPVVAEYFGNIRTDPLRFSFGKVRRGEETSVTVRVESKLGPEFSVNGAEVNQSYMEVSSRKLRKGVYEVLLELKRGWDTPAIGGIVTLRTNDVLEPRKTILVHGFVDRT